MIEVNYPSPAFKIKKERGRDYLFDSIRKTWLLLTEEEWVRQNFVQYLIQALQYPASLIALEKELLLNGLKKRFDILVYNNRHEPWMLIECKASNVVLNDTTIEQLLRYNMSIPVPYLVLTNGSYTYAWQKQDNGLLQLTQLPLLQ